MSPRVSKPSWDRLYDVAAAQDGHFTTQQAADAGYSPQLLAKHLRRGRIRRDRRGIYRIVHYPAGEHEDLVVLWLWSEQAGVFSHETALMLHDLSDALPARIHMTLPASWKSRRLRVPRELILHHADVTEEERSWMGAVPVTTVERTLEDCAAAKVPPDLVRDALDEAVDRGLVRSPLPGVVDYLERFFSISRSRPGPGHPSSRRKQRRR